MTFGKAEFKQLRWPLLLTAVLLIAGIASVLYTERNLDDARRALAASQTSRKAAQERVSKVAEEEKEIRSDLVYYQRMVDSGMVGPKNRLDLIDRIAVIKKERRLYEIRYNIGGQIPLDYPGITPTGTLDFVTSRMQLDMMLLHEEDLLNFLGDLRQWGQSYVAPRSCTLTRQDRGGGAATVGVNLTAQCSIDLITLVQVSPENLAK
jgi:hypothetical protein